MTPHLKKCALCGDVRTYGALETTTAGLVCFDCADSHSAPLRDDQLIRISRGRMEIAITQLTDTIRRNASMTDLSDAQHAEAAARNIVGGLMFLGIKDSDA